MVHWLEGFAGTVEGSFFKPPHFVDTKKTPGGSSLSKSLPDIKQLVRSYLSGSFFFFSPNFLWFSIAVSVSIAFPYDFDATIPSLLVTRASVNTALVFTFFGFWHVALYALGWGSRPFNPKRDYKFSKLAHNAFYSTLGALQWTVWEVTFVYIYKTRRLPHAPSPTFSSSSDGVPALIAWSFLVPLIRDLHFYFAHRFMSVFSISLPIVGIRPRAFVLSSLHRMFIQPSPLHVQVCARGSPPKHRHRALCRVEHAPR
jgi:hypothetical protein